MEAKTMTIDLANMWVWITGASSGLGRHLAVEAAGLGARVLLSARSVPALVAVAAECQVRSAASGHVGGHAVLPFDLLDRAARIAAVPQALALAEGSFSLVVLNAGMSQRSSFADLAPAAFDAIVELDFLAPVDVVRELLPSLQPGSGLVFVSSVSGLVGTPGRSAYSAAKHALTGFAAVLRAELWQRNVHVTTVFAGYLRTGLDTAALGPDGAPVGVTSKRTQAGASPELVARKILHDATRGRAHSHVAFSLESRLAIFAARHWPALFASLGSRRKP
jgi:short-subunit dehydrogenase